MTTATKARCKNCRRRILYVEAHPIVAEMTGEAGYWFHPKGNTVWCYSGEINRTLSERHMQAEPVPA